MDNVSAETFTMNITLYDSEGTGISRYLPQLLPGKNLLVFKPIGFVDQGKTPLIDLEKFDLKIYTMNMETTSAAVIPGRFYSFENPVQLQEYLKESPYSINFGNG